MESTQNIKPTIFRQGNYTKADIQNFRSKEGDRIVNERDLIVLQLPELAKIDHPELLSHPEALKKAQGDAVETYEQNENKEERGDWIFYPWNGELLHTLSEQELITLRTNRNRDLITAEEQLSLVGKTVGIAGLSVGSHIALSLLYGNITRTLKLAEFDTLDTSNLNRIPARLADIGKKKLDVLSQKLYDLDPHVTLIPYNDGLDVAALESFVGDDPKPDLIFEAIDDFRMKITLRIAARKAKIPVVMFTSIGDNILVDIERYDLEPDLQLFHGLLGALPEEILNTEITLQKQQEYAVRIVGREHVPPRAIASVKAIGTTLVGRPQLMSTVATTGGLASYVARRILLGDKELSGRYFFPIDSVFAAKNA